MDHQGFEVDSLFRHDWETWLVEAKADSTPLPRDAAPLAHLAARASGPPSRAAVVYRGTRSRAVTEAIADGVRAIRVEDFVSALNGE